MFQQASLILALAFAASSAGQPVSQRVPRVHGKALPDLEITEGTATSKVMKRTLVSRAYLSSLPQVTAVLRPDENFPEFPQAGATITGVDLDVLLKSFAPSDPSAALIVRCRDGYASAFPRDAILDHHPILVLAIDGVTPHIWARRHRTYDPGPYFVSYSNYVPSFRVLAHRDFAQHPAEIVRLEVIPSSKLFAGITPSHADDLPPDSPVIAGLRIAQQNCFRCHNSGDTGGAKARRTWHHLAQIAKSRPNYFENWVHDPKSIDPSAKMPPNLQYDQPTLNALTRYFQTFAP